MRLEGLKGNQAGSDATELGQAKRCKIRARREEERGLLLSRCGTDNPDQGAELERDIENGIESGYSGRGNAEVVDIYRGGEASSRTEIVTAIDGTKGG